MYMYNHLLSICIWRKRLSGSSWITDTELITQDLPTTYNLCWGAPRRCLVHGLCRNSIMECWDFPVFVISYIYAFTPAAASSSDYSKKFYSCLLYYMYKWTGWVMYIMHPLIPASALLVVMLRSAARPADCCLYLTITNITGTRLLAWSKFRFSFFLCVLLGMATDGSVLYNGLFYKIRIMRVYAYVQSMWMSSVS